MQHHSPTLAIEFRAAVKADLEVLLSIETACFDNDRLSRRSFQHWIKADNGILLVAVVAGQVVGYGLVWCHMGTRLSRLYSLAVMQNMQGQGIAAQLLSLLEQQAVARGYLFMRLEVGKDNTPAIELYRRAGYRVFGEYSDYYGDHSDALRMQKTIRQISRETPVRKTPWYQQTTAFTCGPAALMMAMSSLDSDIQLSQSLELQLWREATTIFMTSGHGGCHPLGLVLAAAKRGFACEVYLNTREPLFVDGVRTQEKKAVLSQVHKDFLLEVKQHSEIRLHYKEMSQRRLLTFLQDGYSIVVLISTYRLDNKKAPHWVTVTNADEHCFYVHDPDPSSQDQQAIDCQYMPVAREDFGKMSSFGAGRLRAAIAIRPAVHT